MHHVNCLMIIDPTRTQLLMCRRTTDPYRGLYNFVGGKVEKGESQLNAAYRELEEETGLTHENVTLRRFMTYRWHVQQIHMEVFSGIVKELVPLRAEKHPLCWMDLSHDFFAMEAFAGEGNIGHMVEIARQSGLLIATPPGEETAGQAAVSAALGRQTKADSKKRL